MKNQSLEMIKNIRQVFLLALLSFSFPIHAQLQKGQLVDGIAAVIGNEIILESDITTGKLRQSTGNGRCQQVRVCRKFAEQ